ncbi:FKBP-type peptidyl-prolyl cis-trans isomerase [Kushneria sinocarnis]|uniref:Peptidyl-prolyl cis-trans isomerase n=1 Tax=Kushneria sinocarnis TaxID=595502 RepID=A0A420X169_9GAMM|nr:FKBP-type peptidyl-prolyl cis-trans isomerase [Kushneria sinocarnis]RKR07425.1 FKBP-type peptidyl-prolyl cis-trans isomerase [Kushneria sinocarnis]
MNKLASVATLSALLILSGCSGGSDDSEQTDQANNSQQQSSQQAGNAQAQGGDGSSEQQGAGNGSDNGPFESDQARLSYAIGATMAQNMSQDMSDLDLDTFTQGIRDGYNGNDLKLSQDQISQALKQYQQKMIAQQQQQQQQAAKENKAAGEKFLKQNAQKDGVQTTDSGLQYKVVEEGNGPKPAAEEQVKVDYEGKTIDGEVFDSSYERGQPVTFQVNQVIEGWQQALQMMPEGATWMIYVPAELAYGQGGTGPIGPNQTLIFKVHLIAVGDDVESSVEGAGNAQGGAGQSSSAASATGGSTASEPTTAN